MRFATLLLALVGCAAPGANTTIPQPVAIALADLNGDDLADVVLHARI